ncbi:iron-sulfur cluster repair di-iron protein [Chitinophaga sp. GCM10012297]|uniref:Iron-sulfur cluster repair di-iron protein n=1 Tax=Chitinophaga chungangae TaxID=2821488 RepID=A0ABS3YHL0_9BACT|nr:iron-sulfur cluster repair di-iron protein [Chitinophaga chungangae]MBO9154129.1 iron-sulfur cluster repair di-iron protein [Chitinophaga chungangae]
MNISKEDIIGAVVAADYRAASVFELAGVDFCCNGNRSIETACNEKGIATEDLVRRLQQTLDAPAAVGNIDYASWPPDLLADFIEKKHHRYVTAQVPVIQSLLEKIVRVHGDRHPELAEIKTEFDACAGELTAHMKKEELMLFPFIRKMTVANQAGNHGISAAFGSIRNPINVMIHEHDTEGERFRRIRQLSNGYTVPEDACGTYRAAFATLQAFAEDLHLHIHLENNILFPKSVEMERTR